MRNSLESKKLANSNSAKKTSSVAIKKEETLRSNYEDNNASLFPRKYAKPDFLKEYKAEKPSVVDNDVDNNATNNSQTDNGDEDKNETFPQESILPFNLDGTPHTASIYKTENTNKPVVLNEDLTQIIMTLPNELSKIASTLENITKKFDKVPLMLNSKTAASSSRKFKFHRNEQGLIEAAEEIKESVED